MKLGDDEEKGRGVSIWSAGMKWSKSCMKWSSVMKSDGTMTSGYFARRKDKAD